MQRQYANIARVRLPPSLSHSSVTNRQPIVAITVVKFCLRLLSRLVRETIYVLILSKR